MPRLNNDLDFRAKATFGVALAALTLLFPIAILNFFEGKTLTGVGSLSIVGLLATNVWLVTTGRCHQNLTLLCLVPAGMLFMITVFRYDGFIASLWCYPSTVACYCMLSERRAWLANLCILALSLPMIATTLPINYAIRVSATLIAISVFSAILVRVIDTLNKKLQYQLEHDPLTNLFNRITLKSKLEQSIKHHHETGSVSSLLAIDVDDFKLINDRYGHDVGDVALVGLARAIRDNLRVDDHAFRIGGEEFLVLLNCSNEKQANAIAERLRTAIELSEIVPQSTVTVSIGAAQYDGKQSWTQWIKRSDDLLYDAKRLGKNRVAITRATKLATVADYQPSNKSTGTKP